MWAMNKGSVAGGGEVGDGRREGAKTQLRIDPFSKLSRPEGYCTAHHCFPVTHWNHFKREWFLIWPLSRRCDLPLQLI